MSSPPRQPLRRAALGSAFNLVGSAVAAAATFALTVVITRFGTATEAGVFFSATSLFLVATSLGVLGTDTGLVYFISRSRAQGRTASIPAVMRAASRPVLFVAALMAIGLFIGAEFLARSLGGGNADSFQQYMQIMAFCVPVAAISSLAISGTQGFGTMKVTALLDQVLRPTLQLLLVMAALVMVGTGAVPIAWVLAYVPVAVVGWLWWRRLRDAEKAPPQEATGSVGREFWRFSIPRALASASQILMQRLDIILVGALAGMAEAAVYAAATRFLVVGQMAGRAFSLSVQPLLGSAIARGAKKEVRELYQVCTSWLIAGTWPVYWTLIWLAPVVLRIFGPGYENGTHALIILCAAMLIATGCGSVDMVLNMAGKSLWNLLNVLSALAVYLVLDFWLIPHLGFVGAAIGWAAAIVVANLLPLSQVLRVPGVHPFGIGARRSMIYSTALFGALPLLLGLLIEDRLVSWLVAALIAVPSYSLLIYRTRDVLRADVLLATLRWRPRRASGRQVRTERTHTS